MISSKNQNSSSPALIHEYSDLCVPWWSLWMENTAIGCDIGLNLCDALLSARLKPDGETLDPMPRSKSCILPSWPGEKNHTCSLKGRTQGCWEWSQPWGECICRPSTWGLSIFSCWGYSPDLPVKRSLSQASVIRSRELLPQIRKYFLLLRSVNKSCTHFLPWFSDIYCWFLWCPHSATLGLHDVLIYIDQKSFWQPKLDTEV